MLAGLTFSWPESFVCETLSEESRPSASHSAKDRGTGRNEDASPSCHEKSMRQVLSRDGMDVKTVQALLGHSKAAITLDMYADPSEQGRAAGLGTRLVVLNLCGQYT